MIDRSRRRLLARLLATTGTLAFARGALAGPPVPRVPAPQSRPDPPGDGRFLRPLRIPGDGGLMAQVRLDRPLELTARVDTLPVFPGLATDVWNYSTPLGDKAAHNPLLVGRSGGLVDVLLRNRLGQDTTIHWHGMIVDEKNDGSGLHPVRHDAQYRYRFKVHNRAGLYWYHAHPHFRTGEQVHQGLAGLLLLEDPEELALRERLDLPWGRQDIPLLLADKQLGLRNALDYAAGADDWIGNRMLVNWSPEPFLDVQRTLYRFRLANLANARMFRPAFVHGGKPLPFWLIGTDGGLLERSHRVDDVFLAPAQRLDVLVDLAGVPAGSRVKLRSLAYEPMENDAAAAGEDPMLEHPGAPMMGEAIDLMELRIGDAPPVRRDVPRELSTLPSAPADGTPSRRFHIRISDTGRWMINEWNFLLDGHAPAFEVKRGDREIWEFRNEFLSMPHPLHVHGFQFRVLSRDKSPRQIRRQAVASGNRTPHDLGLLDTVVVWPGETVRIAIDFSQPFKGRQTYMLHCHNLEHEDQGMMLSFVVRD